MPGMIADARQQAAPMEQSAAPGQPPAQPVPGGEDAGYTNEGFEKGTEEEQAGYRQLMTAAYEILWSEETHDQVVAMLKEGASSPEVTMAGVVVLIITQMDDASGGSIPEGLLFSPVTELVEQLGEIAQQTGAFPVDVGLLNRVAQESLTQLKTIYELSNEDMEQLLELVPKEQLEGIRSEQEQYAVAPPERQAAPQQGLGQPGAKG